MWVQKLVIFSLKVLDLRSLLFIEYPWITICNENRVFVSKTEKYGITEEFLGSIISEESKQILMDSNLNESNLSFKNLQDVQTILELHHKFLATSKPLWQHLHSYLIRWVFYDAGATIWDVNDSDAKIEASM